MKYNIQNKVKFYLSYELLNRVKSLKSFKGIPKGYWILGVQSQEDSFNRFDDKFYLFKGDTLILETYGTTNSGAYGLKNYNDYNKNGAAIIKTDEWYYKLWKSGLHKGRMPALVQCNKIKYYRDPNKNNKIEQKGKLRKGIIGINFHTINYNLKDTDFHRSKIGGWSTGCQVCADIADYITIISLIRNKNKKISYCLIKEF